VEDALEEDEMLEMAEMPEQDRRLAVSGVGRRFGEGVRDREAVSVEEESTFVLMAVFMRKQINVVDSIVSKEWLQLVHRRRDDWIDPACSACK
jgi:hypothetical protein